MPITISRRHLLQTAGSIAVASLVPWEAFGAEEVAPHHIVLFSDMHIDADPKTVSKSCNMYDHWVWACGQASAIRPRPAAVIINGDCALKDGQAGDYATFLLPLEPLIEAGIPVHCSVGNHDHRQRFWAALPQDAKRQKDVPDHNVLLIPLERANIFVLDSLEEVAKPPGIVGPEQLAWLARALETHADKPAIVMIHHNPTGLIPNDTGLKDTDAVMQVLMEHKQVKAFLFGHTHEWRYLNHDGLHLLNLPATAYPFTPGKLLGWVEMNLKTDSATAKLHCLAPNDKQDGQVIEMKWRT